ncbi:GNAT family N-acetyltransferase [Streptacidiphilus monticola]|uniref:GNAT family N-acetyltransferase n=1 Tax=Streptacidiphilus monticola TaxID=2161674 RepID=A0ABW1G6Q5_9ACTN
MPRLALAPAVFTPDEISAVVDLYRTNPGYCRASGEYDPDEVRADQVEADLREEAEQSEVLLARDPDGRIVGLLCLLPEHPRDGHPWIGLLLVHGDLHGQGLGRGLAVLAEERFRTHPSGGLRLAVLENNPSALAFWTALGWREIARRRDVQHGRPCIVMHRQLA